MIILVLLIVFPEFFPFIIIPVVFDPACKVLMLSNHPAGMILKIPAILMVTLPFVAIFTVPGLTHGLAKLPSLLLPMTSLIMIEFSVVPTRMSPLPLLLMSARKLFHSFIVLVIFKNLLTGSLASTSTAVSAGLELISASLSGDGLETPAFATSTGSDVVVVEGVPSGNGKEFTANIKRAAPKRKAEERILVC